MTGTWAILDSAGTTVQGLVVADSATAQANGWIQVKPGMVVGSKLVNGTWVTPTPLPPVAQAGQAQATTAPGHLQSAYQLMQLANSLVAGTDLPTANAVEVVQQLAAGLIDVVQSLWIVSTLLGYREDLPSTVAITTVDMPAGTPVTTINCTPLSGAVAASDTLFLMVGSGQVAVTASAAADHAATSVAIASFTPSADIPAGTLLVDEVYP